MRRFIGGPGRASLDEVRRSQRDPGRRRRRSRLAACESLESRALLATLNISLTGALDFNSVAGVADNLSIAVTAPTGNYVISDSTTTITLLSGAIHAGWKFVGSSNNAVTGPVASVRSITADAKDGNDTVTVLAAEAPVTLDFTNQAGNLDTVVIGGAAGQGVRGVADAVTINNGLGTTNLTVDDSADTQGQTATITSTTITGLAPSPINYSAANLASLSVNGGEGGNTFTVASLPSAIVTLSTGASAAINPNHANTNKVAVLSTTDPANKNTLVINSQGLDTVNLSSGTTIKVTGTAKISHAADSLTVNATGADNVTLANSAAGSLNGAVLLAGAPGSIALTLDDSADATARVVLVSGGVIAGLLPAPVSYTPDDLTSLTLIGAGRLDTLNVNADKLGPVAVAAGASVGSGTITIGSALPLVYQGMAAVNVTNAADQGLTTQNTTVVTTTGDAPLEGKAFPYLVASFVDADVNAKSSNFTAVINWGDGSAPSAGSISSQGTLNGQPLFDVSASHTYTQAGTYSVVVTIADTGTGAVPSEIGGIPVTITDLGGSALTTGSTAQVNLVSNGAYPAANIDANLVNPWGIASSPTSPFWVANNGTSLSTLYNGAGTPQSLVVSIPGGAPTGVAFNPFATGSPSEFVISSGSSSGPAIFLFATQSGQIDGWNPAVPPPAPSTSAQVAVSIPGAQFTGLALATNGGSDVLYAADFHNGKVDMFDSNFNLTGSFTDPSLPAGYAPYNVTNIGGDLYVTFAKQDATAQNPVPGLGEGFVDVFSPAGALLTQLVANAPLNEPWGVALAPADFGQFSGDLLVANTGDGRINAFNPATGAFVGALVDGSNNPIVIPGLHGLIFGNGGSAGAANTLFFTAGSTSGNQGLLGSLTPTPFTAQIGEAALKASVVNVSAVEGNPFIGVVANFTDDNPYSQPADYTATINWGDGSPPSTGTVQAGNGLGAYVVVVDSADHNTHTYAEETGSPNHLGPYNISVTITENDGAASVSADGFASVADAPLLPAVGFGPSGTLDANVPIAPFTTATFVDTNPGATVSDFVSEGQSGVALIDWGDGSASLGTVIDTGAVAGGESFAVQGGHTYLKGGPFQIKTSIVDIGGKSTSATANVVVNALHASVVNVSAVEGNVFSGVIANFTDDNTTAVASDFSASVNWGGLGTGSSVLIVPGSTAGAFIVLGTFLYAEETGSALQPQPYNISVTIDDSPIGGGSVARVSGFASVADAALVAGPTLPVNVTEGVTPTGVLLATFADANALAVPADFVANGVSGAATIDWGDGTASLGTIAGPVGGPFTITGTKPSPYVKVGTSEIKISVTDLGGKSTSMVANVTIAEAALSGTGVDVSGTEGEPLIDPVTGSTSVEVATFTDPNTSASATDFRATIDWGDGSSGSGLVVADPSGVAGLFDVLGSHKYAKAGTYDITVTVNDSAGDAGGFQLPIDPTADIAGETLAAGQVFPALTTKVGTPLNNTGIGTFLVTNPTPIAGPQPDTAADFSVSINWGDGNANDTVTGSVSIVGNVMQGGASYTVFRVSGSHTYNAAGNFSVTATITDDDGGDPTVGPLQVTVQPTIYALTAEPATANLPEGVPQTGEVIATVTDTNPNATFAAPSITSENPDITATNAMVTLIAGTNTYVVTADLSGDDSSNTGAERDGGGLLITITDTNSNMSTAVSSQVNLYDPVLLDPGVKVQAAPGRLFQGPVASFSTTDSKAATSDFTAVINWGDGQSSSGTIVATGSGGFGVVGDHNYAAPGVFSVSTTITNDEGMSVSDTSTASVSTPISARGVTIAPLARKKFAGAVATFLTHVPVPASDFAALITWSDGATSPGVVVAQRASPGGERFKILGTHAFSRKVRVAGTVSIVENGGAPTIVAIGGRAGRQTTKVTHAVASQSPQSQVRKPDVVGAAHPKGPHAEFAVYGWLDKTKSRHSGHAKS